MLKRLWTAAKDELDYLDLVVVAGLGVLFTVLGALNLTTGDTLTQAALGLLALLAFSLLRDRRSRERIEEALATTVEETRRALREMQSDYPFHVRSLELRYDLTAPDGSLVKATKTREIRFTRNNVVSITEYHDTTGDVEEHTIKGRLAGGEYLKPLPRVAQLRDQKGRPIQLVSLERQCGIGDIMEIVTNRTLRDSFTGPRESVLLAVDTPTDEVVFHVTWPVGTPPRSLELHREGGRATGGPIALGELEQQEDGRRVLVKKVSDPQEGEQITLLWDWEPRPAP